MIRNVCLWRRFLKFVLLATGTLSLPQCSGMLHTIVQKGLQNDGSLNESFPIPSNLSFNPSLGGLSEGYVSPSEPYLIVLTPELDFGSGNIEIEYSFDGGNTWTRQKIDVSQSSIQITFPDGLTENVEIPVLVRFRDAVSSEYSQSSIIVIKVDMTPPATPSLVEVPANLEGEVTGFIGDSTPAFELPSPMTGERLQVRLNDAEIYTTLGEGVSTFVNEVALADGEHTLEYRFIDLAGNVSPSTQTISFTMDSVAPNSPDYGSIDPISPATTATPKLKGNRNSADTARIKIYQNNTCTEQIGAGSVAEFESDGIVAQVSENSLTNIYLKAVDFAGNHSAACVFSVAYTHNPLIGLPSAADSLLSLSSNFLNSGESVTLTLQVKDVAGNNLSEGGATVLFSISDSGTSTGTLTSIDDNNDGTYTATFTGALAGTATTIHATLNGISVTSTTNVTVSAGEASKVVFLAEAESVDIDTCSDSFIIQLQDASSNFVTQAGSPRIVQLSMALQDGSAVSGSLTFWSSSDCSTTQIADPLSDFAISIGQHSATFYIKHDEVEDIRITAASSGLSSDTSDVEITAGDSNCAGVTTVGTTCPEGGIFAGDFNSFSYMTTPGQCNESTTPTCNGGTDTLILFWGSTGIDHNSNSTTDGLANTAAILAAESEAGLAQFCSNMLYAGYTDWFLPAKDELNFLYTNKVSIGDFILANYASSTQSGNNAFWEQDFFDGTQSDAWWGYKNVLSAVRCVRKWPSSPPPSPSSPPNAELSVDANTAEYWSFNVNSTSSNGSIFPSTTIQSTTTKFGGGALSMTSGGGDTVNLINAIDLESNFTIEAWFRVEDTLGHGISRPSVSCFESAWTAEIFRLELLEGTYEWKFTVTDASFGNQSVTSSNAQGPADADVWMHIVGQLKDGVPEIWVNGVKTVGNNALVAVPHAQCKHLVVDVSQTSDPVSGGSSTYHIDDLMLSNDIVRYE